MMISNHSKKWAICSVVSLIMAFVMSRSAYQDDSNNRMTSNTWLFIFCLAAFGTSLYRLCLNLTDENQILIYNNMLMPGANLPGGAYPNQIQQEEPEEPEDSSANLP